MTLLWDEEGFDMRSEASSTHALARTRFAVVALFIVAFVTSMFIASHASVKPADAASYFTPSSGVWYEIKNVKSGKYLNIKGNGNANNVNVDIYQRDNTVGEVFRFTSSKAGWYYFTPKCATGRAVNIYGSAAANKLNVCLWEITNHSTQAWKMEKVSGGYVFRSVNNSAYVLTATGTANSSNVNIQKYVSGNTYQIWTISRSEKYSPTPKPTTTNTNTGTTNTDADTDADADTGDDEAPAAPAPLSTLAASPKLQATTMAKGTSNGLSGAVTSNKKITAITGRIVRKSDNKVMYYKTVYPNTASYKLTGTINNAMLFNKLALGTYRFEVVAKDASGNKITKAITFTVKQGLSKTLSYDKTKVAKLKCQNAIGDHVRCGAFAISYSRAIYKKTYKYQSNYWGAGGAQWAKGGMKSYNPKTFQDELNRAYAQVKAGKPCIIRVYEKSTFSSKPGGHYVVVIGYKNVVNPNKITLSQLVFMDPYDGKVVAGNKRHEDPRGRANGRYQIIYF